MNFLALSLVLSILCGAFFFFFGQIGAMAANASILLSFEAIIAAAVLVRLNRGIPSLDWRSVELEPVKRLLDKLEDIAKIYIFVVCATLLSMIIIFAVLFVEKLNLQFKTQIVSGLSAVFGVIFGFLISRMANVVWLDLDIVRLQRAVILSAAENDESKQQSELANKNVKAMDSVRITQL